MVNKCRQDWTIVSYDKADHEIWQNRYGQLAMKTKTGELKPLRLVDVYCEITLAARINAAIMILGLTHQGVAEKVGCRQSQVAGWASGKRYPHEENIEKLETLLINPAMRLELGQTRGLMNGIGEVE